MTDDDAEVCTFCGTLVGENWVALEVQRPVFDEGGKQRMTPDYAGGIFCSQAHAARWLAEPLPEPEVVDEVPPGDRLFWLGWGAAALFVLGFFGIGVWSAVQWLLG
jgi:hypothetical protein